MRSGKRVLSGKRMLAGILAAVLVISSVQLPGGIVWAEELSENGIVTDDGINTVGENQEGDTSGLTGEGQSGSQTAPDESNDGTSESGETEGTAPDGGETTPDDGAVSGDDNTSDGENASGDGNVTDGENVSGDDSISDGDGASDDENTSGDEEAADDENTSDDENASEEENVPDGEEEDTESLEDGLLYPAGISENDLAETEQSEEMIEGEIEGAYQFGGAPAKQGNLSVYADSVYAEGAEEYLYAQMLERNESINVYQYKIPADVWSDFISGVINEHPELYFVGKRYRASIRGEYLYEVYLTYDNTLDNAAVERGVSEALATVDASMSDLQKAIVLHDYLTVNCEYDKERLDAGGVPNESHTIYGVFADRIAVCDGYALAYKYLLSQVGIDCYMVTSDEINHAWNMIVLNGEYYQVDVTWDDPTWDRIGRSVHTYMFRSDAAFDPVDAQQKHSGGRVTYGSQTVDYKATDTRYDNAFWTECDSPMVLDGTDCYYVAYDSSTSQYAVKRETLNNLTGSGVTLQSVGNWPVWGGGGSWNGAYSGLFRIGDRLYYNDKASIYSIAMDGTDKRTEYTADTTEGYIYGSAYCQGVVLYTPRQTPNIKEKETVLIAVLDGSSPADVPVQRIELSAYTLELEEGEEAELTAKVYPTYATDTTVLWMSDNEAAAVVSDGKVRAVSAGSGTITATAGGKKAECSITVTAKGDNGALDLDNLSYEYTALDDTKISSAADGKPKLLIFYDTTCGNCQSTIRGISSKISAFAGIDIYAIETNKAAKEEVAEFQTKYGCGEITFSYDTTEGNENSMWAYVRAAITGTPINATWPIICYIDANNRLQYLTMGRQAADEVLSNLKEYCNAAVEAPQIYKITYILNGGTNSPYNPSTYTAEKDTFILWNAERDGYRFEGWYQDAAYTQKVTQIIKGSTGNITLYAKWSPVQTGNLPEIDMTPAEGNVVMGFSGSYYTETADKILSRLNAIRLEACEEGVISPDTGKPLTEADYVPIKWSSDLEAIARLRAAEASVNNAHTRLNGTKWSTVRTMNGEQSSAENLAWNYDGLMEGIEQWYGEKGDWVKQTEGAVTGHYTSIINPYHTYVGVGAFRLSSGGWYSVAQEFSHKNSMDEHKDDSQGACVQYMEVTGSAVKSLAFDKSNVKSVTAGETAGLALNVTATYKGYGGTSKDYSGAYQAGGSWRSSDETVAVVDQTGMVTAKAKGTVKITVSAGSKSAEATLTVDGETEPDTELGRNTDISVKGKEFIYNGAALEPVIVVTDANTVLTEGQDYTLSYLNNRNVGTATVIVTGAGRYYGSAAATFEITPAMLEVRAKDRAILIGDPLPAVHAYEYEVTGLMADDTLLTEPSFSCGITDTTAAGRYDIIPSGADAGNNYVISYRNGRLTVASEYVACMVTFDVQGHGMAPAAIIDVRVGSTIDSPADPAAEGYRFGGWYTDTACTKAWDFETAIVQSDMTLYAKWFDIGDDSEFAIQEIADVYYTGKACKPVVHVYDGDILLKSGRDYQIKYYNNIAANKDGVLKQGNGEGEYFNSALPYVEIIGKGNYTDRIKDGNRDTVKVNFNILRTSIGDGSSLAANGIVLKISDQLAVAKKVQKPFTSIKYVKAMKKDVDFTVRLTAEHARDQEDRSLQRGLELSGAAIPAGYSGEFLLTVEGIGNYEGSICRTVYVSDKAHLIKNAAITIGKNQKNVTYAGRPVRLNAAEVSTPDTFIVKYGKTILKPGRDYTVSYRNHDRVGKAELIITGTGEYVGSKTASFTIKGRAFTAKTVQTQGIVDKVYTGRAITQNGAALTYDTGDGTPQSLRYGTDYTISYSRNMNKGTATMTFKGAADAGYNGSFKKTFKIMAADIGKMKRSATMENMVFSYSKAGVKPVEEIRLTNEAGQTLRSGKDYTLKYTNNKAVAGASDENPPTVTVKGKGNYTGEFSLKFDIVKADLQAEGIQIKTTPMAYKENKAQDYVYKPAVKLMDGKSALRADKDYKIEYRNHTQADYESYIEKIRGQTTPGSDILQEGGPVAVITEAEGSPYRLEQPIVVPLPIYLHKLTAATLNVYVDETQTVYSGGQVTPDVTVSWGGGMIREGENYTVSYGKNIASGKKKGSVVISGVAPYYGGSVTVKFDIVKKPITY